ncbi:hypothetical protein ACNKW1_04030 [Thauera sp. WH-2]|jgi:methyl-accepting chemotaxis protein
MKRIAQSADETSTAARDMSDSATRLREQTGLLAQAIAGFRT